ncbi:hypothetical protein GBP94_26645 [Mycobacterium avium subsp. hominissuis]|nr:hypothetical protein [Mycobacterium avium subsp. hominissuis]MBZ4528141.1 hypothetical protein [Mycobacterium avium subsp. hominissuis]MBZ4547352.1 hypothetical protein [Mycobacterium avium subsp. hominissuis]MBZ4557077.1 hypothetical protein [Mycobacterium avium subsp. hominissuis]MBZ4566734.1 hypothetical protein [Mycobacterium avium subsp. hominissuis]
MDVAVGYFNLRGWREFDSLVNMKVDAGVKGPVVRILIGMVIGGPQQETLENLQSMVDGTEQPDADGNAARERKALLLEQLRTQLMRGLPLAADRAALQSLRDLIDQGAVQLKVFTRRPLHGKTYICHRQDLNNPITGFVGSSNLTGPGLTTNYELNVDLVETVGAQALATWFEDRWNDRFSRPIDAELLDLLDDSWATKQPRRPYEVSLKVCYDLSRDVREGLAEYSVQRAAYLALPATPYCRPPASGRQHTVSPRQETGCRRSGQPAPGPHSCCAPRRIATRRGCPRR